MAKAKLVSLGDSLTQGFQSGAISRTDLSYPSMIADRMGLLPSEFRIPDFIGAGGFPFNAELLARDFQERYGNDLDLFEWLSSPVSIAEFMAKTEDYWERGPGSKPVADVAYHNLAFWGATVADSYYLSAGTCKEKISVPNRDGWYSTPSNSFYRSAYRVLNPAQTPERNSDTQLSIARRISKTDGIENLIVALGANNCLGTVCDLRVRTSADDPARNLWTPKDFAIDYEGLAKEVSSIQNPDGTKPKVFVSNVPHVTIPPVSRGVMANKRQLPEGERYYDFYTRFTIEDSSFDPNTDPKLQKSEVVLIDQTIDEYNNTIARIAGDNGWILVNLCSLLDGLASRRNHDQRILPPWVPSEVYNDLTTRFFEIESKGSSSRLKSGGLFALDGIHPTTTGYALVAQAFIEEMKPEGVQVQDVNFARIRKMDSLVTNPPRTLDDMFSALQSIERFVHFSRWGR